jgi:2-polyprenyl-6-methoxyphenol hydroxylase-like FAD-dependent oxidoreductase
MFGHSIFKTGKDDIVVIGLGPTGLAYALEAGRNDSFKRRVIILTDRESYTRDVIFRLDLPVFEYYRQLIGETAYQAALQKGLISSEQDADVSGFFSQVIPHRVIKICTSESLLHQQLSKIPEVTIITLAKHTADKILSIQKKSNSIFFQKDNKTHVLHYSYLIEADGVHHPTLNLVNDRPYYHTTQKSQMHSHHARINFNLPLGYTADQFRELLKKGTQIKPTIAQLHQLGWEHQSTPEFRLFVVEDTFYVGGECPFAIQTDEKNKIEAWVRLSLHLFLPKDIIAALTVREAATFNVKLDETDRSTMTLSPGHATPGILFLTGEALRKSHYQTGSGAAVGLLEAKAFGEFLKTPQSRSDLQKYESDVSSIIADNRVRVDRYLTHRAEREAVAQQQLSQASSYQSQPANDGMKHSRVAGETTRSLTTSSPNRVQSFINHKSARASAVRVSEPAAWDSKSKTSRPAALGTSVSATRIPASAVRTLVNHSTSTINYHNSSALFSRQHNFAYPDKRNSVASVAPEFRGSSVTYVHKK